MSNTDIKLNDYWADAFLKLLEATYGRSYVFDEEVAQQFTKVSIHFTDHNGRAVVDAAAGLLCVQVDITSIAEMHSVDLDTVVYILMRDGYLRPAQPVLH